MIVPQFERALRLERLDPDLGRDRPYVRLEYSTSGSERVSFNVFNDEPTIFGLERQVLLPDDVGTRGTVVGIRLIPQPVPEVVEKSIDRYGLLWRSTEVNTQHVAGIGHKAASSHTSYGVVLKEPHFTHAGFQCPDLRDMSVALKVPEQDHGHFVPSALAHLWVPELYRVSN